MADWKVVKEFRDGGVAITVSATDSHRPMYSLSVWKLNGDQVYRFFPLRIRSALGRVEAEPSIGPVIAKLVGQAEQWCVEQAQAREDEIMVELEARERAQADKGKQQKPRGTHAFGKKGEP
jgi:hypothetical protein